MDYTNIIDLIFEKQLRLSKLKQDKWNSKNSEQLTNTEWSILALLYGKLPTISEVAQQLGITRQATHKTMKALDAKGLIVVNPVENNHRNKCIKLTPLGEEIYHENQKIKNEMEKEIGQKIGQDKLYLLKELLKGDWN